MLKDAKVFHVILSGGEPFSNFEVLKAAMKMLKENLLLLAAILT